MSIRRIMGANNGLNFASNDGYWQIGRTNSPVQIVNNKIYSIELEDTRTNRILRVENTKTIGTSANQHLKIYICGLNIGNYVYGDELFIGKVYHHFKYKNIFH